MHHPTQGSWDESPHTQDGDPFLWPNERVSTGSHQPSHSPELRTGQQGEPFYSQGPDPTHTSIGQIAADHKRVSARVTALTEADERRARTIDEMLKAEERRQKMMEDILSDLETIKTRLSALEDRGADGVQERKSGGTSRIGSNNHLSLKVSTSSSRMY
jgi:hypothetical protein